MDLNDTPEQAAYREQARGWLEANKEHAPPLTGSYEDMVYIDARRDWQRQLAEAGLAAVTWPRIPDRGNSAWPNLAPASSWKPFPHSLTKVDVGLSPHPSGADGMR